MAAMADTKAKVENVEINEFINDVKFGLTDRRAHWDVGEGGVSEYSNGAGVEGMSDTEWSAQTKLDLINLVHEYPALWNNMSEEYKDRDIRQGALLKIAEHMRKPAGECLRVWNTLRSSYARELTLFRKSGRRKKKWQFLDPLSFLHDIIGSRVLPFSKYPQVPFVATGGVYIEDLTGDNGIEEDESNVIATTSPSVSGDSFRDLPHLPNNGNARGEKRWSVENDILRDTSRKKIKNNWDYYGNHQNQNVNGDMGSGCSSALNFPMIEAASNGHLGSSVSETCVKFGQYIASCLNDMAPKQRAEAQLKIQQVLYALTVDEPT